MENFLPTLLFALGLLAGGGGGYWIAKRTFDVTIKGLNQRIADLEELRQQAEQASDAETEKQHRILEEKMRDVLRTFETTLKQTVTDQVKEQNLIEGKITTLLAEQKEILKTAEKDEQAFFGNLKEEGKKLNDEALVHAKIQQNEHREKLEANLTAFHTTITTAFSEQKTQQATLAEAVAKLDASHGHTIEQAQQQTREFFSRLNEVGKEIRQTSSQTVELNNERMHKSVQTSLNDFASKLSERFTEQSLEVKELSTHIKLMQDESTALRETTNTLASAMRSESQRQGAWGEFVLTRILEAAGLQEGIHFTQQGKGMQLTTDEGRYQKPDIILNLPENKHIVIDAKTSLRSMEDYQAAKDDEARGLAMNQLMRSVKGHVNDLATKSYASNDGVNAPEFVLMFMPLDSVLALLSTNDQTRTLYDLAWENQIVFVGPSTLMATLKVIESVWRLEKQNENAKTIAELGRRMLDKLDAMYADFDKVSQRLQAAQDSVDDARRKIDGRGGVSSLGNRMRGLGVKSKKAGVAKVAAADAQEIVDDLDYLEDADDGNGTQTAT